MKPICLEFSAFGPYLDTTVLDFTDLNASRLFLISGPTGGGKTSILDAMCFALYCRATGGKRDFMSMRCAAASQDTPTFVRFDFALGKEIYRFRRECYLRQNRNTKNWEMHTTHECFRKNGESMELMESGSETAVRKKAEGLLHLTCEQFSQVIVLPQGNFLQFLRANSKEKGVMLETLFSAGIWRRISEILNKRLKGLDGNNQKLMAAKASLLRQEEVEEEGELDEKIRAGMAFALQYREQSVKLTKELSQKNAELTAAERFLTLYTANMTAEKQLAVTKENYKQSEKAFASAAENKRRGEALAAEAVKASRYEARLQESKAQLIRIQGMQEEAQRLTKKADLDEKRLEELHAQLLEAEKRLRAGTAFQQKAQESSGLLSQLLESHGKDTEKLRAFEELDRLRQAYAEAMKIHKAGQQAEVKSRMVAAALSEKLNMEEARSREDAAYRLTFVLKDGEPCPVCGATAHPKPAKSMDGCIGPRELQALRDSERNAREESIRLRSVCTQMAAEEQKALQLCMEQEEICKNRTDESYEELQKQVKETQDQITECKREVALLPRANEKVEELKQKKEDLTALRNQVKTEAAAMRAAAEGLIKSAKQALKEIPYTDLAALQKEIEKAGARLRRLQTESEQCLVLYQNAERTLTQAKAFYESAKASAEKAAGEYDAFESPWNAEKMPQLESLREQAHRLSEQSLLLSKKIGSAENALASVRKVKEATDEIGRELQQNEAVYGRVALLARSFAGGNSQKTPILQYVLSIMLDEILAAANSFFSMLSRGRYALGRMESHKGGNALGGLDIEVMDGASSVYRSVETLSGGEQFLASLSLAFGLSDVVQNASGAVVLDALFIDEGFGSLDAETLETAMRALSMIRDNGRTVGVISHVSEMKQYIRTKIEVTRDSAGFAHAAVKADV